MVSALLLACALLSADEPQGDEGHGAQPSPAAYKEAAARAGHDASTR